ncbi:hypothetical protein KC345_g211 [Hortaea werneckii]|nr:hypothetical protein KC345_g211 [Hortaea werneckii]
MPFAVAKRLTRRKEALEFEPGLGTGLSQFQGTGKLSFYRVCALLVSEIVVWFWDRTRSCGTRRHRVEPEKLLDYTRNIAFQPHGAKRRQPPVKGPDTLFQHPREVCDNEREEFIPRSRREDTFDGESESLPSPFEPLDDQVLTGSTTVVFSFPIVIFGRDAVVHIPEGLAQHGPQTRPHDLLDHDLQRLVHELRGLSFESFIEIPERALNECGFVSEGEPVAHSILRVECLLLTNDAFHVFERRRWRL